MSRFESADTAGRLLCRFVLLPVLGGQSVMTPLGLCSRDCRGGNVKGNIRGEEKKITKKGTENAQRTQSRREEREKWE